MSEIAPPRFSRTAIALGIAGLLPQIAAVLVALHPPHRVLALTLGYFYAAIILSFLGGIWWGVAVSRHDAPRWLFLAAIVPSLVAFGTALMWITGRGGWHPILTILGSALLLSVAIDWLLNKRGLVGDAMFRLRIGLSAGLGGLTLLLAGTGMG
jgi:Protein of unknown function (DUF3429)